MRQATQSVAQRVDVLRLEHVRRQDADDVRIAARAGQDVARRAVRAARPSPGDACAGRAGNPRPACRSPGPTTQVSRICRDSVRTFSSRPSLSMMSTTVSIIAQAIGPPPNVVPRSSDLQVRRDVIGHQQRRARKAGAERLRGRDHVGRDAVHVRGERVARAAHAALHFVEDRAARRPRCSARATPAGTARPRSTAPPTPCTGSTMTAAVSVPTMRSIASRSPRGTNSTSNGACGKPYHFCIAPQVTAPAAAVRPWKLPSTATTLRRPVILQRELERVLVRLGARVDEEHGVQPKAREAREARRGARAHLERHGVALEDQRVRLLLERREQARMASSRARRPRGRRRGRGCAARRACAGTRRDASTTSSGHCA